MEALLFCWTLLASTFLLDDPVLEKAYGRYLEEPVKRLLIAVPWGDPDVRIAVLQPAWREVLDDGRDEKFRALYASHYLGALLHAGRAAEAVGVWDSLPAQTRALVLARPNVLLTVDGEQLDRNFIDVRLDLAAALALRNRADEALPLIPDDNPDSPLVKLVRSYVSRSAEDPYDIVAAFANRSRIPLWGRLVYAQLFVELATRHGYGEVAQWVYQRATEHYSWDAGKLKLPDDLLADWKRVRAETARQVLRKKTADVSRDAMSAQIARSLAAPRIVAYTEKPLPPTVQAAPARPDVARPAYLWTVRVEKNGDETITVALWDSVYCIVRTGEKPLVTGLRISDGYLVTQTSAFPILQGDRLRLEVHGGKYIELALADLLRDSDGDGLTDLNEEHLLTDPGQVDTDGDGLRDGADLLPLIALRPGTSDEAEVLRIVMAEQKGMPLLVGSREDFRHFRADHWVTVLTPEELALAKQKFGSHHSSSFTPVVIDHKRSKATVQWDSGSSGGTMILERRGGIWVKIKVSTWIS